MRRWFLSYHSPDEALAERLKAALERRDRDSRVFFAPSSLRAGGFWSTALAEEIAQADAFILLVGDKGIGDWQVLEYDEALDRRVKSPNFAVVLVLLEGQTAPGLPFLRRLHWIVTADPGSENDIARLIDAAAGAGTRLGELWRYTSPYRGLAAMEEKDSDYFFGREKEIVDVVSALAGAPDRLPVLLGNSGVGKSSLAQAGVLAALKRQAWPECTDGAPEWPHAFQEGRRWCFLTLKPGTEPLKALVEAFVDTWQFGATHPDRVKHRNGWIELLRDGNAMLRDLLDATERRYKELDQTKPPAFLLYIDQGEELYVRAEERLRRRFSEVVAQGVADPRLYMLMSMRADFLGELQKDEPLFKVHRKIDVPPLREEELREVVSRPAELLSARFETAGLADIIARRTAEDSVKDVGALPLLSYTLDDMWTQMVTRDDGVLRLPVQSFELGGVLVDRADAFLAAHPKSEDELRRIFTLKLATVREGEEPTRRHAVRSEFTDAQWRLVSELADHPNRLVVTATPEGSEAYAEVAHEAVFRRWQKLRDWIAAERGFLAWRSGLEAARRAWQTTPARSKNDALLMGFGLVQARKWWGERTEDISESDREFIAQSSRAARRRARRVRTLVGVPALGLVGGLVGWLNEARLWEQWRWFTVTRPYMMAEVHPHVLAAEAEQTLKAGDSFKECARDCPEMVVVPAGEFIMGSPPSEAGRFNNEEPQHNVAFARPFAVAKFDVTFDDWDACAAYGDCDPRVSDSGYGRGRQPVINVTWDDAQHYAAWLSRMTGKPYRLLSEAEFEYAARGETPTAYPWGNEVGKNNANCIGCGSQWDNRQPSPVGSFAANRFGLHDMHGNVWQWIEDCYHKSYQGAPQDGSAWVEGGNCNQRVVRGGSWVNLPQYLRSAFRVGFTSDNRIINLGFRVGRTLFTPCIFISLPLGSRGEAPGRVVFSGLGLPNER
jgi:formylglycine-generating enzyme required for sulfatase activity